MKKELSQQLDKLVLALVREFLIESKLERAHQSLTVQASLERDLGIGSLEKAELFHRVEKTFSIHLPDIVMAEANSIQELIDAIKKAGPRQQVFTREFQSPLSAVDLDLSSAETLVDVLKLYADAIPHRPHIYLQDEQGNEQVISYGKLFDKATMASHGLVQYGLKQGDTVAIMLPTSEEFFYIFFGVLLAGGIPVPIYPPYRPDRIEEYAKREVNVLQNAEIRLLVTFQRAEGLSKLLQAFIPSLKAVVTADALILEAGAAPSITIESESAALIQYTSGSTGAPKGVLLTHQNLLANIRAFLKAANVQSHDVVVSWLPLYHDMGLIGSWLGSLYGGMPVTILSPLTFLSHPERWLWAIHYHRGTISAGPNFAYELTVRKVDEKDIEGLDLSSWRLAFNGAEMIYPKTLQKFTKKFSRYGFKPETIFPVYGLAETSVALTFPPVGRLPRIDRVVRSSLEKNQLAIPATASENDFLEFVCCGKPLPDHEIRVVDENGESVTERVIGSLQFSGPSAMQGYYHNQPATLAIYHDGWWDTGDYAYLADGEVFITGRKKDIIIKAGRNLYPDSIEEIASQVTGVRKGCVIAFGVFDSKLATENLIIVAETHANEVNLIEQIRSEITEKITEGVGIPPDYVVLVPPHTIPKTSSGKLQRSACKQMYLQNKLEKRRIPVWLQISKLFFVGFGKKIRRATANVGRFFYSVYFALILLVVPLIWLGVAIATPRIAAKIARWGARAIFILVGCPITLSGKENLTKFWPMIIVANHASYIDALLLLAVLPADINFVGKKELLNLVVVGTFFRKLNYLAVDRMDFSQNLADTERITVALQDNRSIVIFPEGTFTYATGLRPFKHGAFKVAMDSGKPICPVAIAGTRNILRDGSWLPRWGSIKVTFCEPIVPQEQGWHEVVRLRTEARTAIAKYCGEQTIDLIVAGPLPKA